MLVFTLILTSLSHIESFGKDADKLDLPYIACDVCQRALENLFDSVEKTRNEAPYKKIGEETIQDLILASCSPDDIGGEWIRKVDIVNTKKETGTFLDLQTPGGVSKCGAECKSIVSSCDSLLKDEIDPDELSAILWKNKLSKQQIKKEVCSSQTSRCSKKRKPIAHVRVDHEFVPISAKDLQMEQLMATMKASGMGGMSMYNRDDMERMMESGDMGGMMQDYVDEEEEIGDDDM